MRVRMTRMMLVAATLAAILAAGGTALATSYGTITYDFGDYQSRAAGWVNIYTPVPAHSGRTYVGEYFLNNPRAATGQGPVIVDIVNKGSPLPVFCLDVYQNIYIGQTNVQFTVKDLQDAPVVGALPGVNMEGTKADYLRDLIFHHYASTIGSKQNAIAFGAAVWEVVFENQAGAFGPGLWDTTLGNMRTDALTCDAGDRLVLTAALVTGNGWLGTLEADAHGVEAYALTNPDYQDFGLVVGSGYAPPVPEPLTMLGVLLGVSGLAGYIRKRGQA